MESYMILVFITTVLVTAVLGQDVHLELDHRKILNNSVLSYTELGLGSSTLKCVTRRVHCCCRENKTIAEWFTPSGDIADTKTQFQRSWRGCDDQRAGCIYIFRIMNAFVPSIEEGLYHCIIPAPNGNISTLYVGIYSNSIDAKPSINGITFCQLSPEMFTLTCISTGGPATNITWTLDGSKVTYDANHVLTQTVVNTITAEYNNTLTVTGREPGNYQCTVSNTRGSDTSQLLVALDTEIITPTATSDSQNPSTSSHLPKMLTPTTTSDSQTDPPSSSHQPEVSVTFTSVIVGFVMAAVLLVVTVVLSVVIVLLVLRLRHLSASLQNNPGSEMVDGPGVIPVEECVAYGPHSHGQQQTEDHEYETAILQEPLSKGRRKEGEGGGGGEGGGRIIYSEPAYELGVVSENPAQGKVVLPSATEETVYEQLD